MFFNCLKMFRTVLGVTNSNSKVFTEFLPFNLLKLLLRRAIGSAAFLELILEQIFLILLQKKLFSRSAICLGLLISPFSVEKTLLEQEKLSSQPTF